MERHGRGCGDVVYVGERVVFQSMYPVDRLHALGVLMISVLSECQCSQNPRIVQREIGSI